MDDSRTVELRACGARVGERVFPGADVCVERDFDPLLSLARVDFLPLAPWSDSHTPEDHARMQAQVRAYVDGVAMGAAD